MREQLNQYHGKKIVSTYDDSNGTSTHTVYEIQGDGKVWQNAVQQGNHHAVAAILKKDCWNEVGQGNSLAEALQIAKTPKVESTEEVATEKGE